MSSGKENKLILVAGAGSGIGKSVLENLNLLNQTAIGVSRTGKIWEPSDDFEPGTNFQCNLSRQSEVLEFVAALKKRPLAGVYFTFGSGLFKPVGQIALEEWNALFCSQSEFPLFAYERNTSVAKTGFVFVLSVFDCGVSGFCEFHRLLCEPTCHRGFCKSSSRGIEVAGNSGHHRLSGCGVYGNLERQGRI